MFEKMGLVARVEALAVELLRGAGLCADDGHAALALVIDDAAEGLLALLDALVAVRGTASCGEAAD